MKTTTLLLVSSHLVAAQVINPNEIVSADAAAVTALQGLISGPRPGDVSSRSLRSATPVGPIIATVPGLVRPAATSTSSEASSASSVTTSARSEGSSTSSVVVETSTSSIVVVISSPPPPTEGAATSTSTGLATSASTEAVVTDGGNATLPVILPTIVPETSILIPSPIAPLPTNNLPTNNTGRPVYPIIPDVTGSATLVEPTATGTAGTPTVTAVVTASASQNQVGALVIAALAVFYLF